MEHRRFLACLILAALLLQVSPFKIFVEELEDRVVLNCNASTGHIYRKEGELFLGEKSVNLGKRILDPRGTFKCNGTDDNSEKEEKEVILQVYYRMCLNCVELDSATLAGIVVTDIIASLLLAVGVYCFAGHETGRSFGAVDTQTLLRNEQLYQPLRDRDDVQYSRIGGNWPRQK
ncbi:T-cell surface glycoprotein CD3 delta chain [Tamandua tetradactyla]|uniref:T-cell surface glycoprotein CD3 delta chain n=1 Tax=Tamandua tetradactyla TaxID=48850 RepID=UPI004054544D